MASIAVAGSITRQEVEGGPLADLNINDVSNYKIITVGPGTLEWQRQYASSIYVHGDYLVNAVKAQGTLPLAVRVKGTTQSQIDSNLAALCRALEQFTYQLTITLEGVTWTWQCDPADYGVDEKGEFSKFHRLAKQTVVTAQIPRHPVPIAGSV